MSYRTEQEYIYRKRKKEKNAIEEGSTNKTGFMFAYLISYG